MLNNDLVLQPEEESQGFTRKQMHHMPNCGCRISGLCVTGAALFSPAVQTNCYTCRLVIHQILLQLLSTESETRLEYHFAERDGIHVGDVRDEPSDMLWTLMQLLISPH